MKQKAKHRHAGNNHNQPDIVQAFPIVISTGFQRALNLLLSSQIIVLQNKHLEIVVKSVVKLAH